MTEWLFWTILVLATIFLLLLVLRLLQPISPELDAATLLLIAAGYARMGLREEAVRRYKRALELDPENAEARALLQEALQHQKMSHAD